MARAYRHATWLVWFDFRSFQYWGGAAVALNQVTGRERAMTTPSQPSRRHYESVGDAAARVGVSTKTVRRWIASGQLAGRIGPRLLRIDPDDVDRMLTLIPTARAV